MDGEMKLREEVIIRERRIGPPAVSSAYGRASKPASRILAGRWQAGRQVRASAKTTPASEAAQADQDQTRRDETRRAEGARTGEARAAGSDVRAGDWAARAQKSPTGRCSMALEGRDHPGRPDAGRS